jgi:two-component system cell cycle response regulator DivK
MPAQPLVLLVDDFEDAREMYAGYLEFRGMRVLCAEGGRKAVAYAREHRPDLILMDLRMPDVSGFEAMRTLRSDPSFCRVPIVALTAHALDREQAAAAQAGFDAVVTKPCLPDELFKIVVKLIATWRPGSSTPKDG